MYRIVQLEMNGTSEAFINRLEARAYSRATEVREKVTTAILNIFPETVRDKVAISQEKTNGHLGIPIMVHVGTLDNHKLTSSVMQDIFSNLTANELTSILDTLELRTDEECTLFLRIDKQAAYLEDIKMATVSDVISLQVHMMKWPRCSFTDAEQLIRQLISLAGVLER